MSGPYGRAVCDTCDQYVEQLCEEHEDICNYCCEDMEHGSNEEDEDVV